MNIGKGIAIAGIWLAAALALYSPPVANMTGGDIFWVALLLFITSAGVAES